MPAVTGFSEQQLDAVLGETGLMGNQQGHPRSASQFAVARPGKAQSQAWSEFRCDQRIDDKARSECRPLIERLNGVSAVVSDKDFSLLYVPVAVVQYRANDSEHRHFVSLKTGSFSGDLPLDEQTVRKECEKAWDSQRNLEVGRWVVASVLFPALAFLGSHLWWGDTGAFTSHWILWSGGLLAGVVMLASGASPWHDFVWNRRAYLFRILADPPPSLMPAMHQGQDAERIKNSVKDMAERNALEDVQHTRAISVLEHPAKVLLRSSGLPGVRIPMLLKVVITTVISAWVGYSAFADMKKRTSPEPTPGNQSASVSFADTDKRTPEEPSVAKAIPLPAEPPVARAIPLSTEPSNPSPFDSAQPPGSASFPAAPARPSHAEEVARSNPVAPPTPSHTSNSRLPNAKAELAEVEATIETERSRWNDAVNVINQLTNYKRTPVAQGSSSYYQCVQASNVIKEVERKAPGLNAKKTRLENTIRDLEQASPATPAPAP